MAEDGTEDGTQTIAIVELFVVQFVVLELIERKRQFVVELILVGFVLLVLIYFLLHLLLLIIIIALSLSLERQTPQTLQTTLM